MVIPVKRITAEGGINLQDLQDFARLRAGELFYLYLNAKMFFRQLSFFRILFAIGNRIC